VGQFQDGIYTTRRSAPERAPEPEPEPDARPVSVRRTAEVLGITPRAVRKRIAAGALRAQYVDQAWLVWLPADPTPQRGPDAAPEPGQGPQPAHARHNQRSWHCAARLGAAAQLVHVSVGEEAVAVGACAHLTDEDDLINTHRGYGIAEGIDIMGIIGALMGKTSGSCKGKGDSMHITDVDKGMLGANDVGMLAVLIGQIAAVSTQYGPVTSAGQSQMSIVSLARS
jgi:hypothetical protein